MGKAEIQETATGLGIDLLRDDGKDKTIAELTEEIDSKMAGSLPTDPPAEGDNDGSVSAESPVGEEKAGSEGQDSGEESDQGGEQPQGSSGSPPDETKDEGGDSVADEDEGGDRVTESEDEPSEEELESRREKTLDDFISEALPQIRESTDIDDLTDGLTSGELPDVLKDAVRSRIKELAKGGGAPNPTAVHAQSEGFETAMALRTTSKFIATQWWHLHKGKQITAPKTVIQSLLGAKLVEKQ